MRLRDGGTQVLQTLLENVDQFIGILTFLESVVLKMQIIGWVSPTQNFLSGCFLSVVLNEAVEEIGEGDDK